MGYIVILVVLLAAVPLAVALVLAGGRHRRNRGPQDSVTARQPAAEGAMVGKGTPDAGVEDSERRRR